MKADAPSRREPSLYTVPLKVPPGGSIIHLNVASCREGGDPVHDARHQCPLESEIVARVEAGLVDKAVRSMLFSLRRKGRAAVVAVPKSASRCRFDDLRADLLQQLGHRRLVGLDGAGAAVVGLRYLLTPAFTSSRSTPPKLHAGHFGFNLGAEYF